MDKTINNTIFENKQEYVTILQMSETLIRYLNDTKFKFEKDEPKQIKELKTVRDNAFAGLLRDGLEYVFITEQEPKLLRLTIDNVNYDCSEEDMQKVLKEDYTKITGLESQIKINEDDNTEKEETLNEIISIDESDIENNNDENNAKENNAEDNKSKLDELIKSNEILESKELKNEKIDMCDSNSKIEQESFEENNNKKNNILDKIQNTQEDSTDNQLSNVFPESFSLDNTETDKSSNDLSDKIINTEKLKVPEFQNELNENINKNKLLSFEENEKKDRTEEKIENNESSEKIKEGKEPIVFNSLLDAGFKVKKNKNEKKTLKEVPPTIEVVSEKTNKNNKLYETQKNHSFFVFGDYSLEIKIPEHEPLLKKLYVIPLDIEENTQNAKFIVYHPAEKFNEENIYTVADEFGNAHIVLSDINILVKASFSNGRFHTFIVPEGQSAIDGVTIEKNGTEHQSKDRSKTNYGVICYKINNNIIRVIPLDFKNNETGNAKVDIIIEKDKNFDIYHNVGEKIFEITIDNKKYTPINYWKGDILSSELL